MDKEHGIIKGKFKVFGGDIILGLISIFAGVGLLVCYFLKIFTLWNELLFYAGVWGLVVIGLLAIMKSVISAKSSKVTFTDQRVYGKNVFKKFSYSIDDVDKVKTLAAINGNGIKIYLKNGKKIRLNYVKNKKAIVESISEYLKPAE